MRVDIRDPDPDTANFPNGAYTLPKGRLYIETSPVGFYGAEQEHPFDLPMGILWYATVSPIISSSASSPTA